MDEPTIGLDVLVKQKIREAIKQMNAKYNTTVILTTHDMQDIEDLCKRIVIIENGRIIFDGPTESIKHRFGDLRTVTVSAKTLPNDDALDNFGGRLSFERKDESLLLKFDAEKLPLEEVIDYAFHTLHAKDIKVAEVSVEDVVRNLLEEQERSARV